MSRPTPQPTPKQNFLQTMLIVATVFLAWNLFFGQGRSQPQQAPQTMQQVLEKLRDDNRKLLDLTAAHDLGELEKKVDEQEKAGKLTKDDASQLRLEGAILTADTQLKAGLKWDETQRIRMAFYKLDALSNKLAEQPLWTKATFEVPPAAYKPERFPWTSWTGQSLYAHVVDTLQQRNRTDLVWGIIPGGHAFIDFLVHLTGAIPSFSYWFAALLLAVCVRALIYPLSQKQLMWSRQMSQLVPLTKEIKEKYTGQEQQVKIMELYKEYGMNPMAGCFPALIQMPLFLFVYQCMVHYQFDFQKGTFLWINHANSVATKGFIANDLGHMDLILVIIYAVSMVISTLLAPVSDPTQVKQQRMIGLSVAIIFPVFMFTGAIPIVAAFVLYWTFTNILATAQSLRAYRLPLPPLVKVNTPAGGVYPGGIPTVKGNGKMNGKVIEQNKTGAPAKHKPKKRK
jgi:YidC/Oxa1 family membrane protein insertase